jgi:hypothetical protein
LNRLTSSEVSLVQRVKCSFLHLRQPKRLLIQDRSFVGGCESADARICKTGFLKALRGKQSAQKADCRRRGREICKRNGNIPIQNETSSPDPRLQKGKAQAQAQRLRAPSLTEARTKFFIKATDILVVTSVLIATAAATAGRTACACASETKSKKLC